MINLAKINKTKYALLGVLNIMSGSGYDIKKFCDSSIGFFWHENYGHIYPVLQRMESEELVTKQVQQTEGKPSRNVYSITEKGKNELETWLKLPAEQQPVRSEMLLKIFLSKDMPVDNIISNMKQLKEDSEKELLQYSQIENLLKTKKDAINKKELILWFITLNNGKMDAESKIKWCEDTIKVLKEIEDL